MKRLTRRTFLGGLGAGAALSGSAPRAARRRRQDESGLPGRTPHTKFAVNVEMWWSELPFLDRIRRAAELGFPAVEFWPWRGKDLDAIGELCRTLQVDVAQFTAWGFEPGMNHPENQDEFEAEIRASCAMAQKLGAKHATIVAGNDQQGMTKEQMLDQVTSACKRVAPIAEDHDVTLILEPMNGRVDHPGHCLYGSPDAVRICRAVDSTHVKINWDLYHMQISEGDLCGRLREGFDQIGYVQLADHPGRNEPGTGEIHYPRVLRELHELGYRGYVGLECRPQGSGDEAAQAVHAADQW